MKKQQISSTGEPIYNPWEQSGQLERYVKENFSGEVFAVFWLEQTVAFAKFDNESNRFQVHPSLHLAADVMPMQYLLEARIFDKEKELHLWRRQRHLQARLRCDVGGEICDSVVTDQVVWGCVQDCVNGWSHFEEKGRGISVYLPVNHPLKTQVALQTRYYIRKNPLGQAEYYDMRFYKFIPIKKNQPREGA